VKVYHTKGQHTVSLEMFNPKTGLSLTGKKHDAFLDAEERKAQSQYEADKAHTRKFSVEELEKWWRHVDHSAELIDGEWYTDCPKCHGTRRGKVQPTKTLRVNFRMENDRGKVGVVSCNAVISRAKGVEQRCTYGTGLKPYHVIAERRGVKPGTVLKEMNKFIVFSRGKQQ